MYTNGMYILYINHSVVRKGQGKGQKLPGRLPES
jgi:hypothetical protein